MMCRLTGCRRIELEARFLAQTKLLPNGCRVWIGCQSKGGPGKERKKTRGGPYGSFKIGKDADGIDHNSKRAHIVSAFFMGLIPTLRVPKGFHIDHDDTVCQSGTLCVTHLRLIPDKENIRLGHRPVPATARQIAQEITADRRARLNRGKLKRARARRQRGAGNPVRMAHGRA